MSKPFTTRQACEHLELLKPQLRSVLVSFDDLCFPDGYAEIENIRALSQKTQQEINCSDEPYLNDMFALTKYLDLFLEYGKLWENIFGQHFSDSWSSLQNTLDLLRLIKKFSAINIQFFENQLIELEQTYPYNVFFSIGASVEFFRVQHLRCKHRLC